MMRTIILALASLTVTAPAFAQSSASTYSYGTYNPVQAAINRNSMNAAILRQATGGHGRTHHPIRSRPHRARR